MQLKITIGQYLDKFLDKFSIDEVSGSEELQYLYNRIRGKKDIHGGIAPLIAKGEFLALSQKHMPEIFTEQPKTRHHV